MNNTALILLVSRETIPNFLSIKTFDEAGYYIFLTSNEMEDSEKGNRREWTVKACDLEENTYDFILVDAYKKESVLKNLQDYDWSRFESIIVNITGGTKIMALAAYEFFSSRKAQIWYTPENDNSTYYQLNDHSNSRLISYKTSVDEYLRCRGIEKSENHYSEKQPTFKQNITKDFFNKFIGDEIKKEALESLRLLLRADSANKLFLKYLEKGLKLNEKQIPVEDFDEMLTKENIKEYIKEVGFEEYVDDGILHKELVTYLTGGWFEEYVYNILSEKITNKNNIKLGVVLNQKPKKRRQANYFTNNDLDIVLTNSNTFYLIECKSAGMSDKELFNKTAYTASALRKYFGLTVKSVLCTLSQLNELQKERAEILDVTVFDLNTFSNKDEYHKIYEYFQLI